MCYMIYTKKGDKGETSLFEPNPKERCRVSKASLRVQAIGAVDEVNSYLGVANFYCSDTDTKEYVKTIQRTLFTIGAILSKAPLTLASSVTSDMEARIDQIEGELPALRNFLMPEGGESAVHFMYARALARRAERRVVVLSKKEEVPAEVLEFLNRLSDYLFCVFRLLNSQDKQPEELWIGKKGGK